MQASILSEFLLAALSLGFCANAATTTATNAATWKLVWSDEFNLPDGSAPASSNWVYDLGGGGWGNNELQTYTDRQENVRIANGMLVIEARKETFQGKDRKQRDYTSARLKTQGKASWTYGRIEARMKLPSGQGIWPAFWALGEDIRTTGWPRCGEIDIMENIGLEPAIVHGTVHGPGYSGGKGIGGPYSLPTSANFANDFHLYAVEWASERIRWSVDGKVFFSVSQFNLPPGAKWVFDHPHFLILNLAVGGNWPGSPNETTAFPQKLLVDYVRVYTAEPSSAAAESKKAYP